MKKSILFFLLISSVIGFLQPVKAQSDKEKLPFKMTVTKVPFDNQPDYFGGGNGTPYTWTDFPLCPVEIDSEYWVIYKSGDGPGVFRWKGTNIENCKRQPDGITQFPTWRPYMLGGMWYDSTEKKLYAPLHCEYYNNYMGFHRQIHLASSSDKGLTWHYEGPIVTRYVTDLQPSEFSGSYWHGGVGDFMIYVDQRGGYIYLYSATYVWSKKTGVHGEDGFARHEVARCAISDKMMPGKWHKFYNGSWDEPGLGGKASYVNAYFVMYNSYLKKYIGMSYGSSLAVCNDLTKQDWTPGFKINGDYWGCNGTWAWHVTDSKSTNIFTGGQTLYLYSYWNAQQKPIAKKYKIDFLNGETLSVAGYSPEGMFFKPIVSTDATTFYPIEPFYESADPIENRHTRRVHCTSVEMSYSGKWNDEEYNQYSDKSVKTNETSGATVQFTFRGADVYWRAVKGPDCGKADVYIDDNFQKTVDCYSSLSTAKQFAFIKTGLTPKVSHTIKVVVLGKKCDLSKGTAIKHLLFEYSADSYRASDGFSSIQGKNGWYYQQKNGTVYTDMVFENKSWVGDKCEFNISQYRNEIGSLRMFSLALDVVRKWVAPHNGTVRIEGEIVRDGFDVIAPKALILLNEKEIWPLGMKIGSDKQPHDFTTVVKKGDAIRFIVKGNCDKNPVRVNWDPVITFTDDNDSH